MTKDQNLDNYYNLEFLISKILLAVLLHCSLSMDALQRKKIKFSNFVLFRINNLQSRWSRDIIRSGDRREQCHVMVRQVTKDCRDQN